MILGGKSCPICNAVVGNRNTFCSRTCARSRRSGALNNAWKGGRYWHKGHQRWFVRIDGKTVLEHRYIMEQHLGRKLAPDEVVHHINEVPTDNRIENLLVMKRGDHIALHNYLDPRLDHVRDDLGRFSLKDDKNI